MTDRIAKGDEHKSGAKWLAGAGVVTFLKFQSCL